MKQAAGLADMVRHGGRCRPRDVQVSDGGAAPPISLCDPAIPVQDMETARYQCQQSVLGRVTALTLKEEITAPFINWAR